MSPNNILRCGTSGWSHPDWNSVVYPRVKPRGFHALEYLAQRLDAVEIDSSFAQPVRPEISRLWLSRVSHHPDFQFTAILGRQFTHDRALDSDAVKEFREGLWPLLNAGRFGCLLMRFPWSFRFTRENRDFVVELRRRFHEFPLAAEMRHASWTLDEALGSLMDYKIGFCNIDQPAAARAMAPTAIITSPVGYVRLLGREGDWTRDDTLGDYLYTPLELGEWQTRIERLRAHTTSTFAIAANHTGGKGAVNAMQLKAMTGVMDSPPRRRGAERSQAVSASRRDNPIVFGQKQIPLGA